MEHLNYLIVLVSIECMNIQVLFQAKSSTMFDAFLFHIWDRKPSVFHVT